MRDVTGRGDGDAKTKEAEIGFSRLFAEAPVGIAFLDRDGVVTEANAALFQMIGRSRDEVVGTGVGDYLIPGDWADLKDKMAKLVTARMNRVSAEVKLTTKQEKIAAVYVTPMTEEDEDGSPEVFGFIAHFIDNTERPSNC